MPSLEVRQAAVHISALLKEMRLLKRVDAPESLHPMPPPPDFTSKALSEDERRPLKLSFAFDFTRTMDAHVKQMMLPYDVKAHADGRIT